MTDVFDPVNPPKLCPRCANHGIKSKVKRMPVDAKRDKFVILCKNDKCPWPLSVMSLDKVTDTLPLDDKQQDGSEFDTFKDPVEENFEAEEVQAAETPLFGVVVKEDSQSHPVTHFAVGDNGEIIPEKNKDQKSFSEGFKTSNTTHSRKKKGKYSYWSKKETRKFLYAISVFGLDFSMMESIFKNKDREELKRKFYKEKKKNSYTINKCVNAFINAKRISNDLSWLTDDNNEYNKVEGNVSQQKCISSVFEDQHCDIQVSSRSDMRLDRKERKEGSKMARIKRLNQGAKESNMFEVPVQTIDNGGNDNKKEMLVPIIYTDKSKGHRVKLKHEVSSKLSMKRPRRPSFSFIGSDEEEFAPLRKLGTGVSLDTEVKLLGYEEGRSRDQKVKEGAVVRYHFVNQSRIIGSAFDENIDNGRKGTSPILMTKVGNDVEEFSDDDGNKVKEVVEEYVPTEEEIRVNLEGIVFGGYLPKIIRNEKPPRTGLSNRANGRGGRNYKNLCEHHMMGAVEYLKARAESKENKDNQPPVFKFIGCQMAACKRRKPNDDDMEYKPINFREQTSLDCQNIRKSKRLQDRHSILHPKKFQEEKQDSINENCIEESTNLGIGSQCQIESYIESNVVLRPPRAVVNENYRRRNSVEFERFDKVHIRSKSTLKIKKFLHRSKLKAVRHVHRKFAGFGIKKIDHPEAGKCISTNYETELNGVDKLDELLDDLVKMWDGNNNNNKLGNEEEKVELLQTENVDKVEITNPDDFLIESNKCPRYSLSGDSCNEYSDLRTLSGEGSFPKSEFDEYFEFLNM